MPKAGGTTIQKALSSWFEGKDKYGGVFTHNGDHEKNWECPFRLIKQGVMMGHRGFGYCERAMKTPTFYTVVLREPVSRFVSLINYFLVTDYAPFEKYKKEWGGRELDSIIKEYNHTLSLNLPKKDPRMHFVNMFIGLANQQTAFMCGYECLNAAQNDYTLHEKLQHALNNLQKTDVVVLMDKLDDFIAQMRFHSVVVPRKVKSFPYENKHKRKPSVLSEEAKQILLQWSWADMELYRVGTAIRDNKMEIVNKCAEL